MITIEAFLGPIFGDDWVKLLAFKRRSLQSSACSVSPNKLKERTAANDQIEADHHRIEPPLITCFSVKERTTDDQLENCRE